MVTADELFLTGYSYSHHGTISECDIHLVEFHAGE